jgi:multiple sugar transport system permease protein
MEAEAATWRPKTRRWRRALESRRFLAPALIAPAVIYIVLVVGVPFVWAVYLSLTDAIGGSLSGSWVGFDNFQTAWEDANFRRALRNTLVFTLASQAIVLVGASLCAHYLMRDFRGKWLLRLLIILPWAAPVALSTIGWLWILEPTFSIVNWTAAQLGLVDSLEPPQWLGREHLAMIAIIAIHAWRILPFAVVIFLAGLASIPSEVDDAAKVDGATGLKKMLYVTLPLQLPIALVALLFGIVFTATDFTVVYVLTQGGPFNSTQMLTTWSFQIGINSGSLGEGAAISLYLFPLLVVVSVAMLVFARKAQVS